MQVFENEYVVSFDIDDTMVLWNGNHNQPNDESKPFLNPYDNNYYHLVPHKKHIDLLKIYKGRGMCVMVWSAGGVMWAKSVIEALKLEDYVDLIITKPSKYVDDLQAEEVLGQRVYLKP